MLNKSSWIKLVFVLPASIEQSGVSILMNKSQSDSTWKKNIVFRCYMQLRCWIILVLYLQVYWKDSVWHLELIRLRSTLNIVPNFSKDEDSGKRKFQRLLNLSYMRRTHLKLPILFYHKRPKHRNILANHWIIPFPTLWSKRHSYLSRTVEKIKIMFNALLRPYKCS